MAEAPEERELSVGSFLTLFGGVRGLIDSSLPVLVFIGVRLFADLNTAIVAAVVSGVLIVGLRSVRGEPLQQAFSGFFGLLIAVLFARATGTGKGFFLPGIIITALSGLGFLVSLVVRQPAIALVLVAIDPKYAVWKTLEPLRQACVRSTALWSVTFFVRAAVATAVAVTVGDDAKDNAILFGVIQVEKYALMLGAALYTVAAVRRVHVPDVDQTVDQPVEQP